MKHVKELLKALLAHYPGQDAEWEESWCALFHGHWEDEDINDTCVVNRIYINENNMMIINDEEQLDTLFNYIPDESNTSVIYTKDGNTSISCKPVKIELLNK